MDHCRRYLVGVGLFFAVGALAAQGVPVYTALPALPTQGAACKGSRVQIEHQTGKVWCCTANAWDACGSVDTATTANTAYALVADPSVCVGNDWARGIVASGNAACVQPGFANLSGAAAVTQGGTGVTSSTEDAVLVGSGTGLWQKKTLSGCTAAGSKIAYDAATNEFSCQTSITASALALSADPADCSGNNWARGIGTNGAAACAQPAFSNVSGRLALAQFTDDDVPAAGTRVLINGGPSFEPSWGTVDAALLAPGAVDWSKFADGVRPIKIVAVNPALPDASYPEGAYVYNSADDKLYRSTGTAWASPVGLGQITADEIASNAITTGKIAAGAVGAAEIAAGAVVATKIAAGEIGTSHLAANAVTADKIAANAITAEKIAAQSITASSFYSNYGENLWPNGLSAIAPPANASQAVLDSSEFKGRIPNTYGDQWYMGYYLREVVGGATGARIVHELGAAEGDAFRFRCHTRHDGQVASGIEFVKFDGSVVSGGSFPSVIGWTWVGHSVTATAPIGTVRVRFYLEAGPSTVGHFARIVATRMVTQLELMPASVGLDELEDGSVDEMKLRAWAVYENAIQDGAVTAPKLATDAVETAKIKNANVTTAKLADGAVTLAKLDPTLGARATVDLPVSPGAPSIVGTARNVSGVSAVLVNPPNYRMLRVTFATAMPDTNYHVSMQHEYVSGFSENNANAFWFVAIAKTTTYVDIGVQYPNASTGVATWYHINDRNRRVGVLVSR